MYNFIFLHFNADESNQNTILFYFTLHYLALYRPWTIAFWDFTPCVLPIVSFGIVLFQYYILWFVPEVNSFQKLNLAQLEHHLSVKHFPNLFMFICNITVQLYCWKFGSGYVPIGNRSLTFLFWDRKFSCWSGSCREPAEANDRPFKGKLVFRRKNRVIILTFSALYAYFLANLV